MKSTKSYAQKVKSLLALPLTVLGYKNSMKYQARTWENSGGNEDDFFASFAYDRFQRIRMPSIEEARFFAWDEHPEIMYERYQKLPMAVHAWNRDKAPYADHLSFWKNFIDIK